MNEPGTAPAEPAVAVTLGTGARMMTRVHLGGGGQAITPHLTQISPEYGALSIGTCLDITATSQDALRQLADALTWVADAMFALAVEDAAIEEAAAAS